MDYTKKEIAKWFKEMNSKDDNFRRDYILARNSGQLKKFYRKYGIVDNKKNKRTGKMTQQEIKEYNRNLDMKSKLMVKSLFEKLGFQQVSLTNDEFCPYDLKAMHRTGGWVMVEVKHRTFNHDQYGDIVIEKDKADTMNRLIKDENNSFTNAVVVGVFTDNVIAIDSLNDPNHRIENRLASSTSQIYNGNRQKVMKEFYVLPQKYKYHFNGSVEDENWSDFKKI